MASRRTLAMGLLLAGARDSVTGPLADHLPWKTPQLVSAKPRSLRKAYLLSLTMYEVILLLCNSQRFAPVKRKRIVDPKLLAWAQKGAEAKNFMAFRIF